MHVINVKCHELAQGSPKEEGHCKKKYVYLTETDVVRGAVSIQLQFLIGIISTDMCVFWKHTI